VNIPTSGVRTKVAELHHTAAVTHTHTHEDVNFVVMGHIQVKIND